MSIVGIDFEMANATRGSLCAYGIAYPVGDVAYGVLKLHPEFGGVQERTAYHGISPANTAKGLEPEVLYEKLLMLPKGTILAAHDARIERRELAGWYAMWGFEPLELTWIDTLKIAQLHYGKEAKTGIAAMAQRMHMNVMAHDPVDDALVAQEIALRYSWGNLVPIVDNAPEKV